MKGSKRKAAFMCLLVLSSLSISSLSVVTSAFALNTSGPQIVLPILESCFHWSNYVSSTSCTLPNSVSPGNLILVEVSNLPGITIGDSLGDSFVHVTSVALPQSTYYLQAYYTTASSSGVDTITVSGAGNYPAIVVHELTGVRFGTRYSVGSGTSNTPAVTKYSPGNANTFVLGVMLSLYVPPSVKAGSGYTLIGEYPPVFLADEGAILLTATTSPFTLGNVQNWAEISLAFSYSNRV